MIWWIGLTLWGAGSIVVVLFMVGAHCDDPLEFETEAKR